MGEWVEERRRDLSGRVNSGCQTCELANCDGIFSAMLATTHGFAAPTSDPRSSLPDLPRCAFSPNSIRPGIDCAVDRPDIPLRNAFFSDLRRLSSSERDRAVSLDVGANSGEFSNWIAILGNQVAPGRRLHLVMFDPQPRMARRLTKLVRQLSNLGGVNATFLPVAAWTRTGNASFFSSKKRSVESSLSMSQAGQDSAAQVVRTIDLAAYLHADFFAGAAVRLLKIVSTAIAHRTSPQDLSPSNCPHPPYRCTAAPSDRCISQLSLNSFAPSCAGRGGCRV